MPMQCPGPDAIDKYVRDQLDEQEYLHLTDHINNCRKCATRVQHALENETLLAELRSFKTKDILATSLSAPDQKIIINTSQAQKILGQKYMIQKRIGQGASGVVFLAVDSVLQRDVAVKFINTDQCLSETDQDPLNEGRLMSRLNHPNIAQIYNIGQQDDLQYIIMEHTQGLHLFDAWKDMNLQNRLSLFMQVLNAIDAAHEREVIHRDIKPSNIIVTADGKVKVLDFGIALGTSSHDDSGITRYRGTPAFSAPEQISAPRDICPATDVFALGILLYQLITDTLPFPQTDPDEIFHAIRNSHPELPSAIQQSTPIPLQNICLKALEKNINNRYPDAHSLAADIKRYLRGEKVWSRPTFLTDNIQQEVFYHNQKLSVWRDNDLITEREHDRLTSIYDRVVAPSDQSIIESRKLSFSQVCLYLGGWITIIGSAVLLSDAWDQIPKLMRPVPALLAVFAMLIIGKVLWSKKEPRLAVGFLSTANLLLPVVILITLGHWQILSPENFPLGTEPEIPLSEDVYIGNCQLLISSLAWLGCSALLLRIVRSSIFMIFGILALFAVTTSVFVINDMVEWEPDIIAGRYLIPGIILFIVGTILDRRKYPKYAWPLCFSGLITIVAALSLIANSDNTLFGWLWTGSLDSPLWYQNLFFDTWNDRFCYSDEAKLLSFVCNGLFYLALANICTKQGTRLQRTLAQVLNWLGPLHLLTTLRMLDEETGSDVRVIIYRVLLPITSLAFILASVARQMKSFFFSGLLGIAAAIQKITEEHLRYYFSWPIGLIITGISCMIFSSWLPRLKEKKALKQKD